MGKAKVVYGVAAFVLAVRRGLTSVELVVAGWDLGARSQNGVDEPRRRQTMKCKDALTTEQRQQQHQKPVGR